MKSKPKTHLYYRSTDIHTVQQRRDE